MSESFIKDIEVGGAKYKIEMPNIKQQTEADWEYSKTYSRAMQEGLLPRVAIQKQLEKNGVWTKEDDQRIEAVTAKIQVAATKRAESKDQKEQEEYLDQILDLRDELLKENSSRQALYANSAESKAEESRIAHLVWQCIKKEDGSALWENSEAFLTSKNSKDNASIIYEFISMLSGLDEQAREVDEVLFGDEKPVEEPQEETVKEEPPKEEPEAKVEEASK